MGIKAKYAEWKFKKLVEKHEHKPFFPKIQKAKSIGVLWQPSQKEAFQYLKNHFARGKVLIFRGFCVYEETTNPHPDTNTLTTNDLTWLGLPKHEKIDEFLNFKFDALFNIALTQNMATDYITCLSNARFKVGSSPDDTNYFDLNIKIGEKDDALYLVKQQIFYLAQLNNTTIK